MQSNWEGTLLLELWHSSKFFVTDDFSIRLGVYLSDKVSIL